MPYPSKAIANEFLDTAREVGEWLTPMKVQKLVYYAHGWHLATAGPPLVSEPVEAWRWGPVFRRLYASLADLGDQPIMSNLQELAPVGDGSPAGQTLRLRDLTVDVSDAHGQYAVDVVGRVWDLYGGLTAVQLSKLTHEAGTPWDTVAKHFNYMLPGTPTIPNDTIRAWFRQRARPVPVPAPVLLAGE